MPNRSRKKLREKDTQQLARHILDTVVPDAEPPKARKKAKAKDPAAVALGRKGGLKGGKARAAKMTAEERAASARKAAKARWGHESP
jgi:hypothetical protein